MPRILIVTWEYPPLIEGGLARHVRKLSEALVGLGIEVHVLTRGGEQATIEEEMAGVQIHRIVEPERPTDLGEVAELRRSFPPTVSVVRITADGLGLLWVDGSDLMYEDGRGDVRRLLSEVLNVWTPGA